MKAENKEKVLARGYVITDDKITSKNLAKGNWHALKIFSEKQYAKDNIGNPTIPFRIVRVRVVEE
jgi:hypothetical protein